MLNLLVLITVLFGQTFVVDFIVLGENTMWRARVYRNDPLFRQAKDMKTPSCEALQSLRQSAMGG